MSHLWGSAESIETVQAKCCKQLQTVQSLTTASHLRWLQVCFHWVDGRRVYFWSADLFGHSV